MKKFISLLMAFMICVGVMLVVVPTTEVQAADDPEIVRSGSCIGSVSYTLDNNGVLRLFPTNGETGSFSNSALYNTSGYPWHDGGWKNEIKQVIISGKCTFTYGALDMMFNGCNNIQIADLRGLISSVTSNNRIHLSDPWKYIMPENPTFGISFVNSRTWISEVNPDGSTTYMWPSKAFAVYVESEETLYFVKSSQMANSNITNGNTYTVLNIDGDEYTGRCYKVDETSTSSSRSWHSIASQVKKVQFVDEIKPRSTFGWFQGFRNCIEIDLEKLDTSDVTTMSQMFYGCSSLTSLDVSGFDTSQVTNMGAMFRDCNKLTVIDVSGFDTSKVTYMGYMFMECNAVETLDFSNWATSNVTSMYYMSAFMRNLKSLKLGENFKFVKNDYAAAPYIYGDSATYTGKWIREDKAFGPYTHNELRDNYTGEMAGTWIWELAPTEYTVNFDAGDGTGSMQSATAPAKEDFPIPANLFRNFGYDFDHWDDGNGHTYADQGTIPANTYAADTTVTLTAVFKKRDTSIDWDGNSFEFSIKAGEEAVIDNIPAGTSYQVYELTPDGWVLVQQENSSGVIEALEESAAAFWNKYQPGVTTVQFSGLKTLDGHPAEANAYTFELVENGEVIDTVTTQDGGFIQFKVIEYDDTMLGTHNYIIREVDPNDDAIDYDTHEEQVTVEVTDNGDGTLSSEVTYDADGIAFSNTTRPGTLRITKDATNGTSQNADDTFTIEIEFRNESGMPINDDIYWYIEGGAATPSEITDNNQE